MQVAKTMKRLQTIIANSLQFQVTSVLVCCNDWQQTRWYIIFKANVFVSAAEGVQTFIGQTVESCRQLYEVMQLQNMVRFIWHIDLLDVGRCNYWGRRKENVQTKSSASMWPDGLEQTSWLRLEPNTINIDCQTLKC